MDTFVLSNFDTHFILTTEEGVDGLIAKISNNDATPSGTPGQGEVYKKGLEVDNVINFQTGEITKDTKTYRTLTNDGWESIAVLGQSIGDLTINCIRPSTGLYVGSADASGNTNYEILRKWFDGSLGANTYKARRKIVVISPRVVSGVQGTTYEAIQYNVIPKSFKEGDKDPDAGQEFEVTLAAFGEPVSCKATLTTNDWTFTQSE